MTEEVVSAQLSILVVDDEQLVREMLVIMLEDAGHVVSATADGYEALAFIRAQKAVDIVLSDINMPGMDGLTLSRQIETEFPQLPVLLISGRPRPAGVPAFIAKPFRSEMLVRAVEKLALTSRPTPFRLPGHPGQ